MAKLPVIQQNQQLVTASGQPTFQFTNFLNQLAGGLGTNSSDLTSHLAEIENLYSELKLISGSLPVDVAQRLSAVEVKNQSQDDAINHINVSLSKNPTGSFRGGFVATASPRYIFGDIVTYGGMTWQGVMSAPVTSGTPEETPGTGSRWLLLVQNLNDVLDTIITSPVANQVLKFDGTNWVNGSFTLSLDDLSDVVISTPTSGQILKYNGTNWINSAPPTGLPSLTGNANKILAVKSDESDVEWIVAPTGGGGSGSSLYLAKVFKETATSGLTMLSPTLVPDMTTTFSLSASTDVRIEFAALLTRSGGGRSRFLVKIDGTDYDPINSNQHWYSNDQQENNVQHINLSFVTTLSSGSHTIEVWSSDALVATTTTFWNRALLISDLNGAGGSGGGATALVGLTDVTLTSPTNGQVLTYNSTSSKWENATPSSGSGGTGDLMAISSMTVPTSSDFTITKPSGATATLSNLSGGRGVNLISYPASNGWQGTLLTYNGWTPPSSGSWSFAVLMSGRSVSNGMGWGPAVYDSSNRVLIQGCNSGTNTRWIFDSLNLNNNTNRDATNSESCGDKMIEWWRLRSDGTNIYGERSLDGDNWWITDTVGISWFTSGTLTHVGIASMEYYSTYPQHINIYGIKHS